MNFRLLPSRSLFSLLRIGEFWILIPIFALVVAFLPRWAWSQPVRMTDVWETTLPSLIEGNNSRISILPELNRVDRAARLDYYHRRPYEITGFSGQALVKEEGYSLGFVWPQVTKNHRLIVEFETSAFEQNLSAESRLQTERQSSLILKDELTTERLLLAHNWKVFQMSWGLELKSVHRGTQTRVEPAFEIGWGDLSDARLRFRIFNHREDQRWHWNRSVETLSGKVNFDVEGKVLDLTFGDPFGIQMSLTAGQETWRGINLEDLVTPYSVGIKGSRSYIAIGAEHSPLHKFGWHAGGTHTGFTGEAKLNKYNAGVIGRSKDAAWHSDVWGGGIGLPLSRTSSFEVGAYYIGRDGDASGWLEADSLPTPFIEDFLGTTVFAVDGSLDGGCLTAGLKKRGSWFTVSTQTGLVKLWTNGRIRDLWAYAPEDQEPRTVELPLQQLTGGWSSATVSLSWRNFNIGGIVSQALIIDQKTNGDRIFGDNAEAKGGLMSRMWLGVTI